MITEVPGNILDCPNGVNVIVHQANINRRMGSGVALALINKWPIVAETDKSHNKSQKFNTLGDISACQVESDPQTFVFNLYGQSLFEDSLAGCRTDYNAVVSGFNKVSKVLEHWKKNFNFVPVVGVPKYMGSDLAGGNWEIYSKIIEETFRDTNIDVIIVDFGKTIKR
jgi:O-acetyl-ADP-ribose deacetylase (regulator of RNase III)